LGLGLRALFILLGVILGLHTLVYLNFDPTYGFLKLKAAAVESGWYLPFYYSHVLTGGLILITGFAQFSIRIRKRFPRWHRLAGYFYVMGIIFFSGPGGMVMSLFINRGPVVLTSFIVQCSLWILFTAIAFQKIKKRQIDEHEAYMIRSFALTLAAITLRIYIFVASWFTDLNQPEAYAILSWASWLPNLLIGEWIIRKKITSRLNIIQRKNAVETTAA
jgi:hypothetical protein